MRLVSFGAAGSEVPGVLVEAGAAILPLRPLLDELSLGAAPISAIPALLPLLEESIESMGASGERLVATDEVRLGPPIPEPRNVIVCGMNYLSQITEASDKTGGSPPRAPLMLLRTSASLSGPFDPIVRPPEATGLDWEAELAVVINRATRRIDRGRAVDHVAGYICAQDLGSRSLIAGDADIAPIFAQPTRGKGVDSFCPTGPWLVTPDEVGDPANLTVRMWLNDELVQEESVGELLFDVPALIEWLSALMTLQAGDIILTGAPAGCGAAMDPPRFLAPPDVIRTEIDGLGAMVNEVRDEP
jgi:2-keto-4-pentenoate hydratase/2-oxohepta-3-ene-1,7-dioic acid hydratase in catechol pathway